MGKRLGFTSKQKKQINVTVGKNLAAARKNMNMGQTEVMVALWGVSNNRNRISEIENGKKDLSLFDMLIFQDFYGQSLDYLCGLSTEPEVDMLAGTVNHVVSQSRSMVEHLTTSFAEVMVEHMKTICQNDHVTLVNTVKTLCDIVKTDSASGKASDEAVNACNTVLQVVRHIEVKMARQQQQVDTDMMQIKERLDAEDKHVLLSDADKEYQYSLPLPKPELGLDKYVEGVGD